MAKKFTTKPIRNPKKADSDKTEAEEEIVDFYKQNKNLPEIQKPVYHRGIWVVIILLSILFGFSSSFAYDYFFTSNNIIPGEQKVYIEKQEDVTVTSEERLGEIQEQINPVIVNFYDNSDSVNGPFYQDIYSFGTGFILTSDGWIVTTQAVLDKIKDKNYIILTADYKIYTTEKILTDPATPVVFVKIKASDLPVAKLGDVTDLSPGQKTYSFLASYPHPRVASLHLADLQATTLEDVVASSEKISHYLTCREGYNSSLIGSPIVNLAGEIIAVINNNSIATPVSYLNTIIRNLGKQEKITRTKLGVHYINLAKYPKIDPTTGDMRDKGAFLSGFKNLTAVTKNSPADRAGLQVGDIILRVEDELVNGRKTLAQMIQEYEPDQTLKLIILRNNKEKVIEVELGEYQ